MKLATLKNGSRDGRLVVVSRDLATACAAEGIAATLQQALDNWSNSAGALRHLYESLNRGAAGGAFAFDPRSAMSPLPRAYQWVDGSVYKNHGELMKRAFDTENKVPFREDEPMMYQGGSDDFIGPCDDIPAVDEAWGIDFEGEMAVITDDVPMQTGAAQSATRIRLLMVANDISLRNLIMNELSKGFGFVQSKPTSSFSPVAVTPDELGDAWHGNMAHLPLRLYLNGQEFGKPNAGVGTRFNFGDLIAHVAKTRHLCAGSIIGSGTVSNAGPDAGSACIAERRAIERIAHGEARTPFMKFGDRIRIEMLDAAGKSIFGAIDQTVVQYTAG